MEARMYMDSLSVWAFMKARVSLPCRVSGSLQNKVKYGTSPHKLMVKVVLVASPDLRGADWEGTSGRRRKCLTEVWGTLC